MGVDDIQQLSVGSELRNPAVFRAMLEEMFFIADTGIDILRLDAVAFIWKEMGTSLRELCRRLTR